MRLGRDTKTTDWPFSIRYIRLNDPLFSLSSHSLWAWEACTLGAHEALTLHYTNFEEKNQLFCSLSVRLSSDSSIYPSIVLLKVSLSFICF